LIGVSNERQPAGRAKKRVRRTPETLSNFRESRCFPADRNARFVDVTDTVRATA
jgi:hypothetical protein